LTIADAVLLLRDGAQLAFGPPAEVLRLPVTSSVSKPHVIRHQAEPQKLTVRGTPR
jgi:ATP-binding cassette, subfamily C, bacterial